MSSPVTFKSEHTNFLNYFFIKCQSLKKKFEELSNLLQTAAINTIVAVTETLSNKDFYIENNFSTAMHTFFGKC